MRGDDSYIESLEKERQRMIDEEVRLMQENPGGKGVDIGYTTDARGNINGRRAQSNNPQWYQDAYKQLGRKPTKADLPFLAESRLHDIEEFDTLDRELSPRRVLRDYMREHPEESCDRAIEGNIQRGNQAAEYILREHAKGNVWRRLPKGRISRSRKLCTVKAKKEFVYIMMAILQF